MNNNNHLLTAPFCHCGSCKTYQQCCSPLLEGKAVANSAEGLMRSRFTAFKLKKYQYLINTHCTEESSCPSTIADFDDSMIWLGLKIISLTPQAPRQLPSFVEFVAFYTTTSSQQESTFHQLREKSQFDFINDRWFYIKGEHKSPIKLPRNDACFCGSGKKQKKCHGLG
jgi:SEC-C motif domain protein